MMYFTPFWRSLSETHCLASSTTVDDARQWSVISDKTVFQWVIDAIAQQICNLHRINFFSMTVFKRRIVFCTVHSVQLKRFYPHLFCSTLHSWRNCDSKFCWTASPDNSLHKAPLTCIFEVCESKAYWVWNCLCTKSMSTVKQSGACHAPSTYVSEVPLIDSNINLDSIKLFCTVCYFIRNII